MPQIITEFPITIYENLTPFNQVISKSRCRIFYKYGNRNGAYITDEFAEKLLSTLPYTPVKGIYDGEDYEDHGTKRSEGRIYGIVPQEPNIAWEKFVDKDGIEREYACADVLLFTSLYEEAEEILGKAQSMEIYAPSIKGQWQIIDGKKQYVYTDGCFLGLQVLGEVVEPCFEGAAFYTLVDSVNQLIEKVRQFELDFQEQMIGGNQKMDLINYKLSDREKFDAIWSLLNANYNEENGWIVEYEICEIYEDYALVRNFEKSIFERVYYKKNDETDSLELGEKIRCYIIDVSESEKSALDTIQMLNGNTFEKIDETYSSLNANVDSLTADLETEKETSTNFGLKIEELTSNNATLITENETLVGEVQSLREANATLQVEVDTLTSFKEEVEKKEKMSVIESYADHLSEEIIEKYTTEIGNYTARDLDKELAYELKCANPAIFSIEPPARLPIEDTPKAGLEAILSKYQK